MLKADVKSLKCLLLYPKYTPGFVVYLQSTVYIILSILGGNFQHETEVLGLKNALTWKSSCFKYTENLTRAVNVDLSVSGWLFSCNQHYPFYPCVPILLL